MSRYDYGTNNRYPDPEDIINRYRELVQDRLAMGWKGYILTFMFAALHGNRRSLVIQMNKELERIYATMVTRIVRKPMSDGAVGKLPIWIALPDLPVPKHEKMSLRSVTVNDGLHVHAICLLPPESRIKQLLDDHVADHQGLYVQDRKVVRKFRADLIKKRPAKAVGYVLKSLSRRRFSTDEIIIFPRSRTELDGPRGRGPQGPALSLAA